MLVTLLVVTGLLAGGSSSAARSTDVPLSAVDPGVPGPYATVTGEYDLAPVELPELFEPVEMQAMVVAPKGAAGPRPLVLLLHGFHEVCFDPATKDVRLPQHATLAGYEQNIEWNIHRWCGYWGRGI